MHLPMANVIFTDCGFTLICIMVVLLCVICIDIGFTSYNLY